MLNVQGRVESNFDLGFLIGKTLKTVLEKHIQYLHKNYFELYSQSYESAKERALAQYLQLLTKTFPGLLEEIRGMAEGSALSFEDTFLNSFSDCCDLNCFNN